MKSLWIEDFNHSDIDEVQEDQWRERYNLPREDVILKKDLTTALDYIDRSYNNLKDFDRFDTVILDINLSIGEDIGGKDYRSFLKGVISDEFLELQREEVEKIGGFYIFLKLILDKDFPRDRIVFLTSSYQIDTLNNSIDNLVRIIKKYKNINAISRDVSEVFHSYIRILSDIDEVSSEEVSKALTVGGDSFLNFLKTLRIEINSSKNLSDTYNRYEEIFQGAGIKPPEAYIKENDNYIGKFKNWINEKNTEYYIVRRAVIEISRELTELLESKHEKFILLRGFLHPKTPTEKKQMYSIEYFKEMLYFLQRTLPIKEPNNVDSYYKQIVRSISHDFEVISMVYPYKFKIEDYEQNFLPVMKLLRNWNAHSRVEEEFTAKDVGLLFIIAMRSIFDIGYLFKIDMDTNIGRINYYEKTLITLWNNENTKDDLAELKVEDMLKESFNYITKREYKSYSGREKWRWSESATFNIYKKYEVIGGQNSNGKCHIDDFYRLMWHSIFYSTWEDYESDSNDYTYLNIKFNTIEVYNYLNREDNIIGVLFKYIFTKSIEINENMEK